MTRNLRVHVNKRLIVLIDGLNVIDLVRLGTLVPASEPETPKIPMVSQACSNKRKLGLVYL